MSPYKIRISNSYNWVLFVGWQSSQSAHKVASMGIGCPCRVAPKTSTTWRSWWLAGTQKSLEEWTSATIASGLEQMEAISVGWVIVYTSCEMKLFRKTMYLYCPRTHSILWISEILLILVSRLNVSYGDSVTTGRGKGTVEIFRLSNGTSQVPAWWFIFNDNSRSTEWSMSVRVDNVWPSKDDIYGKMMSYQTRNKGKTPWKVVQKEGVYEQTEKALKQEFELIRSMWLNDVFLVWVSKRFYWTWS